MHYLFELTEIEVVLLTQCCSLVILSYKYCIPNYHMELFLSAVIVSELCRSMHPFPQYMLHSVGISVYLNCGHEALNDLCQIDVPVNAPLVSCPGGFSRGMFRESSPHTVHDRWQSRQCSPPLSVSQSAVAWYEILDLS